MFRYVNFITLQALFLGLSACSTVCTPTVSLKGITVLNESIDPSRLASTHVNAPDPLHEVNPLGQRLTISWKLSPKYEHSQLSGFLKIRYYKAEQVTIPFNVKKRKGVFVFNLLNDEFFEKGGILAYKVQIFSDGKEIESSKHLLWTDLVIQY